MISVSHTSRSTVGDRQALFPARRQFERFKLRKNVLVHYRDRFYTAVMHDISQGGCRLSGTFGLMPGDKVEIELMSGQTFAGKIAWSIGSHVGIAFQVALSFEDADQMKVDPAFQ